MNAAILMTADTVSSAIESDKLNTWQHYIENLLPKWLEGPILVVLAFIAAATGIYLVYDAVKKRIESKRLNAFFHEGKRFRTSKITYSFFRGARTKNSEYEVV